MISHRPHGRTLPTVPVHVALIGCGKAKRDTTAPAKDLYTGTLFRLARAWAETHADRWLVISAAHGLVEPQRVLEPYDRTLAGKSFDAVSQFCFWCQADYARLLMDLGGRPQKITILAGKHYVSPLLKFTAIAHANYELPLSGLGIGDRQKWLRTQSRSPLVQHTFSFMGEARSGTR